MSAHDIDAGTRWGNELGARLQDCNFGIICVTPDNISAPWLLFEAGGLGKSVQQSRVIPYRIGVTVSDVPFPLAQFQSVNADREGTLKLLESVVDGMKFDKAKLNRLFEKFWPDLEKGIKQALEHKDTEARIRPDRELFEEMLQLMRSFDRNIRRQSEPANPSDGAERLPSGDKLAISRQASPAVSPNIENPEPSAGVGRPAPPKSNSVK